MLRMRFKAQTDIDIRDGNLSKYEDWLERLQCKNINSDMLLENEFLRDKLQKAMDIIYEGITGRPK